MISPLMPGRRTPPPAPLKPDEAKVWCDVVDTMPGDWCTPGVQILLKRLCVHVVACEEIERRLRIVRDGAGDDPDALKRLKPCTACIIAWELWV
jgi:hypothetical protein